MDLQKLAQAAAAAAWMRDRLEMTGQTPKGHKLWSDEERALIRQLMPDYDRLCTLLPHRTRRAIRGQAGELGLTQKRHQWTGAECLKLRKLYLNAPMSEVLAAFPDLTRESIQQRARRMGVRRPRRQYYITGIASIDQIRAKCFEIRWSMPDLDKAAGTKGYFSFQHWRGISRPGYKRIGQAIRALDGELVAKWED